MAGLYEGYVGSGMNPERELLKRERIQKLVKRYHELATSPDAVERIEAERLGQELEDMNVDLGLNDGETGEAVERRGWDANNERATPEDIFANMADYELPLADDPLPKAESAPSEVAPLSDASPEAEAPVPSGEVLHLDADDETAAGKDALLQKKLEGREEREEREDHFGRTSVHKRNPLTTGKRGLDIKKPTKERRYGMDLRESHDHE